MLKIIKETIVLILGIIFYLLLIDAIINYGYFIRCEKGMKVLGCIIAEILFIGVTYPTIIKMIKR